MTILLYVAVWIFSGYWEWPFMVEEPLQYNFMMSAFGYTALMDVLMVFLYGIKKITKM